jgi:hypothetical protein
MDDLTDELCYVCAESPVADRIRTMTGRAQVAERALFLAEHLFQMVPRSVWRDSGADDGQGHYEGDYRAEQVQNELAELSRRIGGSAEASRG